MTGKKATTHRKIPAVSEAPPPINPIRGGGYRPRKSKPANYQHWNRFPLLSFDQCLMLLLGIEPGTSIQERSVQDRYNLLWKLIESCRIAGTLPPTNQWNLDEIEPLRFIEWAKSMGEKIPPDWSPPSAPETSGKTIDATNKGVTKQITDSVIIDDIADDIYNRMVEDNFANIRRAGLQKIYDFLITKPKTGLPAKYQLPVMLYWLVDEEEDQRSLYEIGNKRHLGVVEIKYTKRDTDEYGSVPFRKVWKAFNKIKSR